MRFGNPVPGRIAPLGGHDAVSGFGVTQEFKGVGVHDGLDIDQGGADKAPILAIADGEISLAHTRAIGGAHVIRVNHADGWSSGYGHLLDVPTGLHLTVTRGQQIGRMGSSGHSSGPHVHFDISRFDQRLDPWPLLDQNRTNDEEDEWMPLPLRERFERWTVPAGTPFFTDGPGIGLEKRFTTQVNLQTVAESADGEWRLLRFQNSAGAPRELLYVRRKHIRPKVQGGEPAYDAKVVSAITGA